MVKKKNVTVTKLPKAYRGSFSTFMVTMIIISVCFFLPMITANGVEKSRSGQGRWKPMEEMLWDFSETSDYKKVRYTATEDELGNTLGADTGTFDEAGETHSVYWQYHGKRLVPSTLYQNCVDAQQENIVDFAVADPVIDEYGTATLIAGMTDSTNPFTHELTSQTEWKDEVFTLYFDQDSDQWVDQDATRLDFYISFDTTTFTDSRVVITWITGSTGNSYELYDETNDWINGDILSVDVDVNDLISISSIRGSGEYIKIEIIQRTNTPDGNFDEGDIIIYDAQLYGLDSSTPSLTVISVWYIVQSVIIILFGIVMLPNVSIGGLVEYLTNITKS